MNALQWLAENLTEWPGDDVHAVLLVSGTGHVQFYGGNTSRYDFKVPIVTFNFLGCDKEYTRQQWSDARSKLNKPVPAPSALNIQEGGDHYKSLKIQPIEYIHANNIPFAEGSVIKYVTRWRSKNGIADLKKARHFIDLLIELEGREHE